MTTQICNPCMGTTWTHSDWWSHPLLFRLMHTYFFIFVDGRCCSLLTAAAAGAAAVDWLLLLLHRLVLLLQIGRVSLIVQQVALLIRQMVHIHQVIQLAAAGGCCGCCCCCCGCCCCCCCRCFAYVFCCRRQ